MLPHLQITIITIALVIAVTTFELIRRNRLKEEYSFLWFTLSGVLLLLAIWRGSLGLVSHIVGTVYQPSALFMAAALLLLALSMHYSTVLSKLSDETRLLAQQAAILRAELEDLRAKLAAKTAGGA